MNLTSILIASISGLLVAGAGANEMSHGAVAEGMGLGHQHMTDHGGYHCADPGDMDWTQHESHVHNGTHAPGDHCGGGHHAGMGGSGGGHMGGMQ